MLLPTRFMPELLPRRMRELSIDHARKSSRVDFLDKCAKYARILREFRADFVGLCVDLNPFRASRANANPRTFAATVLYLSYFYILQEEKKKKKKKKKANLNCTYPKKNSWVGKYKQSIFYFICKL